MRDRHSHSCEINGPTMHRSLCVLSLFVLSAHAADPAAMLSSLGKQLMAAKDQCLQNHGIDPASITSFSAKTLGRPAKCALACGMTSIGIMNEKGVVNGGFILKMIPDSVPFRSMIGTIINSCTKKNVKDGCDAAFKFVKCLGHQKILKSVIGNMAGQASGLFKILTN